MKPVLVRGAAALVTCDGNAAKADSVCGRAPRDLFPAVFA
jgi:hypothetical protein